MKYLLIIALITPSLGQYMQTGLKPDVTFGDHNDRFDISNFLRQQKYHYKDEILDPQSEEFRRSETKLKEKVKKHKSINHKEDTSWLNLLETRKGRKNIRKKIVKKLEDHVNELANTIISKMRSMRRVSEFAYHDDMNSGSGDIDDYNANLKKFEAKQKLEKDIVTSRRLLDILGEQHKDDKTNLINYKVIEKLGKGKIDNFEAKKNLGKDFVSSSKLQDIVDELHGSKQTRRMITDPQKEILLHYAFPLDINIEGFLQMP